VQRGFFGYHSHGFGSKFFAFDDTSAAFGVDERGAGEKTALVGSVNLSKIFSQNVAPRDGEPGAFTLAVAEFSPSQSRIQLDLPLTWLAAPCY